MNAPVKKARQARMSVSPARLAAFEILRRVEEEGAYSSALLANEDERLKKEDRALLHQLVLGVLRRQIFLDALIEHFASRKIEKLDAPVLIALRLGLYQLRFLSRIPVSAAVNESVNLVHRARLRSASAFVNAALRRAARENDFDPAANVSNEIEKISIETSHPAWLIEKWSKDFGLEETIKFASANNQAAPNSFRFTNKGNDKEKILDELKEAGSGLVSSSIAPDAWRVDPSTKRLHELAREGKIYFQDEASQLVARALDVQPKESVLDLCAAPGSKTTHIATLQPKLKRLVACDVHEHRLNVVKELAERTGVTKLETILLDATEKLSFNEGEFDRVLVDAPCSGTGTLRRNPEIRYRLKADDFVSLSQKQKLILSNASSVVRAGGRLVYSTCSVEREENEAVIEEFLKNKKSFELIAATVKPSLLCSNGTARTWPQRDDVDGFFIAVFERKG
jgi:16S rRNA (cytosine967-C5)-methyltransferase